MQSLSIVLLLTNLAGSPAQQPPLLDISASLPAKELKPGRTYEIVLDLKPADGWSTGGAGFPAPLLQVKTPPSVALAGEKYDEYDELKKHEFLHQPYERLLNELPARIAFTLKEPPGEGQAIHLHVLAYLGSTGGEDARFVRKHIVLPLDPQANAQPGDPSNSDWGTLDIAQVGQPAPDFTLPRADGSKLTLSDYRGKKNVLVTTYRAHW